MGCDDGGGETRGRKESTGVMSSGLPLASGCSAFCNLQQGKERSKDFNPDEEREACQKKIYFATLLFCWCSFHSIIPSLGGDVRGDHEIRQRLILWDFPVEIWASRAIPASNHPNFAGIPGLTLLHTQKQIKNIKLSQHGQVSIEFNYFGFGISEEKNEITTQLPDEVPDWENILPTTTRYSLISSPRTKNGRKQGTEIFFLIPIKLRTNTRQKKIEERVGRVLDSRRRIFQNRWDWLNCRVTEGTGVVTAAVDLIFESEKVVFQIDLISYINVFHNRIYLSLIPNSESFSISQDATNFSTKVFFPFRLHFKTLPMWET